MHDCYRNNSPARPATKYAVISGIPWIRYLRSPNDVALKYPDNEVNPANDASMPNFVLIKFPSAVPITDAFQRRIKSDPLP